MEEAIRNLHMDMISQFHQQSQEINNALANQRATIERLEQENEQLLLENERLRQQLNI
jgi:regulator of replication initiation timing